MSKSKWHHPGIPSDDATRSWRSAGQLADTPEFRGWLEREFPQGAAELDAGEGAEDGGIGRRAFMKLMGASTALAGFGMAACRRPEQYILPCAHGPEWVIPGKPTYYASAMPRPRGATPLVVTTYEGRPTQVAPNRAHPAGQGTDAFALASILDLYSPARSRTVRKHGKRSTLAEFQTALAGLAKPGRKVGFVFGHDDSPTRNRLRKELAEKFPKSKFYAYESLDGDGRRAALRAVGGDGAEAVADFSKADRIVALDCDFLSLDPQGPVAPFFARRKPEGPDHGEKPDKNSLNRLYAVEAAYSLTGGMADHRLRAAPSQVLRVAAALARRIGARTGSNIGEMVAGPEWSDDERLDKWVAACADDLLAHKGRAMVLSGSRQPEAVHRIAMAINAALESLGEDKPLHFVKTGREGLEGLAELVQDIEDGVLDTIFLLGPANPVFDTTPDLEFADLLARDGLVSVHLGPRADATARAATWHVPAAHYLESWGDTFTAEGAHTIVQPMILPLYPDCVSETELLLAFLGDAGALKTGEPETGGPSAALAAVRATFDALPGASEEAWRETLRKGFHTGTKYQPAPIRKIDAAETAELVGICIEAAPARGGYEVVFAADASVWDGRWIDNGWLQEAPDPVSKITWDNAALVSPKTAKKMGVYNKIIELEPVNATPFGRIKNAASPVDGEAQHRRAPMIKVALNGAELELPVLVAFGHADDVITIPLGYGQGFDDEDELGRGPKNANHVGEVGRNRGFDPNPLRTARTPYFATGGAAAPTGRSYSVALTQEHHAMYGRALAREISTTDAGDGKGDFEAQLAMVAKQGQDSHVPPNISLYKSEDKNGKPLISDELHQWGMTIDLSACMGCNACLVACQAENNIPIVGKEQVAMGREMHWIRMDRYFAVQEFKLDARGNQIPDGKGGFLRTPESVRENPEVVPQPVACLQCEMAPCESVCPVNATVHTEDGLNAMAYNRCIGTRYCGNNCPYKARRFNFFDYNKCNPLIAKNLYHGPAGETKRGRAPHLQRNPNVTVRMRGVMEKCTYCVQRLKEAKIRQKRRLKEDVAAAGLPSREVKATIDTLRIPVDSVRTACQDACPAEAIRFGNLLDDKSKGARADSRVVAAKRLERNYDLLNYIGTLPRTSYLARVKNPNPDMPDAKFVGKATIHMV